MKRPIAFMLAAALSLQGVYAAAAADTQKRENIYLDISSYYNSTLYTEVGTALGTESGSGKHFPSACQSSYTAETAEGVGIALSSLSEQMTDGVLSTSGGSRFKPNTTGAVLMGNNEFKIWDLEINETAYGADMLIFGAGGTAAENFYVTAYYEDGTIEDDCGLEITAYAQSNGNSIGVTAVNAVTGVKHSVTRYANVLSMDFKNQYTKPKKLTKLRIGYGHGNYGLAFMAVTLNTVPREYDYSKSVCMDISPWCTGEYMSSEDETPQNSYSGYIYNSQNRIDYDYIEKLTDSESRFKYDGIVYQLAPKQQQYKGIFSYETAEKEISLAVKPGYYDKLSMLVNTISYDGEKSTDSHPRISEVPVEIVYADGTSSKEYISVGYGHAKAYYSNVKGGVAPAMIAGGIRYSISGNEITGKEITAPADYSTQYYGGFIFTAEVPVSEQKPVVRVRIGSAEKRLYLFSLTGIKKESTLSLVSSQISELTAENTVYDTLLPIVQMTEELAAEYVSGGGAYSDIENYNDLCSLKNTLEENIADKGRLEIFVDGSVSENGNGSKSSPLSDIKSAKEKAEENRAFAQNGGEIDIIFAGGEYKVNSTYMLEAEDGVENGKIVYRAADGEEVIFSGTTELNKADFTKVENTELLQRLPESARGRVYSLDLSAYGITLPEYSSDKTPLLFADGEAQQLASYPNEGYTSIESSDITEEGYSAEEYTQIRLYAEDAAQLSALSGGAYAEGFFEYDFNYKKLKISAFDPDTRILTVSGKNSVNCATYSTKPRRLRIVNSLAVLDSAGEWYCDSAANTIYWYPQDFGTVERVAVTLEGDTALKLSDTKNIAIKNIIFSGNIANAAELTNVENILIEGCEFRDISHRAIYMRNHKNTVIRSNKIHDCAMGIEGKSGDLEMLQGSGNIISDNHIYKIGCRQREGKTAAVLVTDVGCEIVHNTIHDMPDAAVRYNGNDIHIAYNEIYNVCREANDAAAVYSGNSYIQRGTVIEYNYFHDILPQYCWAEGKSFEGDVFTSGFAVYFDDAICEQTARKNIIANTACPADLNGGQLNVFEDNIIIGSLAPAILVTSRGMDTEGRAERENREWSSLSDEAKRIYAEKYKGLENGTDYCFGKPAGNRAENNLLVDAKQPSIAQANYDYYGSFENNLMYTAAELDAFADAQAGDYRIKADSAVLESIPGLVTTSVLGMADFGSSLVRLSEYSKNAQELMAAEINEAYECLRKAVCEKRAAWSSFSPLVNKKGESGAVTVNAVKLDGKRLSAVLNIADTQNTYSYKFFAAVYEGDSLVKLYELHSGENEAISARGVEVSETIAEMSPGRKIKYFAWNSLVGMYPLAQQGTIQ